MVLILIERWGMAAGREDRPCRSRSTLEGLGEGTAEMAVGRRFRFRDCAGEEGLEEDMVLGLYLVLSLCSSAAGPRPGQSGGRSLLGLSV